MLKALQTHLHQFKGNRKSTEYSLNLQRSMDLLKLNSPLFISKLNIEKWSQFNLTHLWNYTTSNYQLFRLINNTIKYHCQSWANHCQSFTNPYHPHEATMLGSLGCHSTPIHTLGWPSIVLKFLEVFQS